MSNPNTDLGEWLIDDVLRLPDDKIVTYEILLTIGTDSVEISKINEYTFAINFKKTGAYDNFRAKFVFGEEAEDEDE